ncbi:hypothetical protein [Nocardia donostiensis]|uniref:Lipoprotein n=2 Tax=Nocardia donostiensis TaxID=1538463 RepID=A0A1W0B378_9NOCA|nr:hypothetical protein [Nocardia donostiensis]ONM48672.1 hypothetical protein B0T46_11590 [Nocardia donostiensis]OQS16861.1 hypothetical protein B0T36_04265 [Nocardia donostiensis]
MTRTSVALAAAAAVFALFIAGCQDESGQAQAPTTPAATSTAAGPDLSSAKAGSFVIGFKGAFPALAADRSDTDIRDVFTDTCTDIRERKPENKIVGDLIARTASGEAAATPEEARAIYQMIEVLC